MDTSQNIRANMKSNVSRRTFVQQTMLGSLGLLTGNSLLEDEDGSRQLKEIGLILGVLKKELKADWACEK